MDTTILSALGVGFSLGLKHALDADHLAAVATMIGDRRRTVLGASLVGVRWGVGHAVALTAAGLLVVFTGLQIPPGVAATLEGVVGAVLIILGARLLWGFRRGAVLHSHSHAHGGGEHLHPHVHRPGTDAAHATHHGLPAGARLIASRPGSSLRPFLVGLLHGMAGSAALMLFIIATIPTAGARLTYIVVFAIGSTLGMASMSALVGLPFALGGATAGRMQATLRVAAGLVSVGIGLAMALGFLLGA
ncbi:MAG: urease accessory protein [Acidobacteria bacterium]|nr:urease accessory protein [Acidobacteriota bacterium]